MSSERFQFAMFWLEVNNKTDLGLWLNLKSEITPKRGLTNYDFKSTIEWVLGSAQEILEKKVPSNRSVLKRGGGVKFCN